MLVEQPIGHRNHFLVPGAPAIALVASHEQDGHPPRIECKQNANEATARTKQRPTPLV
jgi:hypothetical protein